MDAIASPRSTRKSNSVVTPFPKKNNSVKIQSETENFEPNCTPKSRVSISSSKMNDGKTPLSTPLKSNTKTPNKPSSSKVQPTVKTDEPLKKVEPLRGHADPIKKPVGSKIPVKTGDALKSTSAKGTVKTPKTTSVTSKKTVIVPSKDEESVHQDQEKVFKEEPRTEVEHNIQSAGVSTPKKISKSVTKCEDEEKLTTVSKVSTPKSTRKVVDPLESKTQMNTDQPKTPMKTDQPKTPMKIDQPKAPMNTDQTMVNPNQQNMHTPKQVQSFVQMEKSKRHSTTEIEIKESSIEKSAINALATPKRKHKRKSRKTPVTTRVQPIKEPDEIDKIFSVLETKGDETKELDISGVTEVSTPVKSIPEDMEESVPKFTTPIKRDVHSKAKEENHVQPKLSTPLRKQIHYHQKRYHDYRAQPRMATPIREAIHKKRKSTANQTYQPQVGSDDDDIDAMDIDETPTVELHSHTETPVQLPSVVSTSVQLPSESLDNEFIDIETVEDVPEEPQRITIQQKEEQDKSDSPVECESVAQPSVPVLETVNMEQSKTSEPEETKKVETSKSETEIEDKEESEEEEEEESNEDEEEETLTEEQIRGMKVVELKAELKKRGISTTGLKKVLIKKLINAVCK